MANAPPVAEDVPNPRPVAEAETKLPPPSADEAPREAWPDESVESGFLAEARERGEPTSVAASAKEETAERTEAGPLPPLNDLVQRIPAEVRDVLEDLFRAKFVAVKRVPPKALKE